MLERIPRRASPRVVLLQHGLLDSSLGWVSNGVVGSQAFAAYDQVRTAPLISGLGPFSPFEELVLKPLADMQVCAISPAIC